LNDAAGAADAPTGRSITHARMRQRVRFGGLCSVRASLAFARCSLNRNEGLGAPREYEHRRTLEWNHTQMTEVQPTTVMPPLVSVAMATYNGADFLARQIDTLVCQSYKPIEIVICDDCSNDSTPEILEYYSLKYPGLVRWSKNEHTIGFIKNFEKVLSMCCGEYLALCDQDDTWVPDKIERLIKAIGVRDLVHSDARVVDEQEREISRSYSSYSVKRTRHRNFHRLLITNTVTGCTAMIRRSLLERAIPFPELLPHDQWLGLLAADGEGIAYLPEPLVNYRKHEKNALGAHRAERDVLALRKVKSLHGLYERRAEFNERRQRWLEDFLAVTKGRFSEKNTTEVEKFAAYYRSFFERKLRIKAFWYHLTHFAALNEKKSLAKAIVNLFLTIRGRP
jgi:glycosyltransferase involved in cell wall biosynthesis